MGSRKPVIHGRDHAPGGADEIPDLGGGGITFAQLEIFAPLTVPVAAGASAAYPWTHSGGQALLPGTGGTAPTPVVEGVYFFLFRVDAVGSSVFTAGRAFWLSLTLNDGIGGSMNATQVCYPGSQLNPARISANVAAYMGPGSAIQAAIVNQDSVAHSLQMQAYASRLG
jgi:hypothetical protein